MAPIKKQLDRSFCTGCSKGFLRSQVVQDFSQQLAYEEDCGSLAFHWWRNPATPCYSYGHPMDNCSKCSECNWIFALISNPEPRIVPDALHVESLKSCLAVLWRTIPKLPKYRTRNKTIFQITDWPVYVYVFLIQLLQKRRWKTNHPNTMGDSNTPKKIMFSRLGWYLKKTLLQQTLDSANQASGKPCASAVRTSTPAASKAETKPCHSLVRDFLVGGFNPSEKY